MYSSVQLPFIEPSSAASRDLSLKEFMVVTLVVLNKATAVKKQNDSLHPHIIIRRTFSKFKRKDA